MKNIHNLRTLQIVPGYTLFECIQSSSWMDYLGGHLGRDSHLPTGELIKLLCRLATRKGIPQDMAAYCSELENSKLYQEWDKDGELERANLIISYLKYKSMYPKALACFMDDTLNNTQKAQQVYDLMDLWGGDKGIRHVFFMLVFKFSMISTRETHTISEAELDLNYIIYEQAAYALWAYLENYDNFAIVLCSKNSKKRFRTKNTRHEWMRWMDGKYPDFLNYIRHVEKNRRKLARVLVFTEFINIYLKGRAQTVVARGNTKSPSAFRVIE